MIKRTEPLYLNEKTNRVYLNKDKLLGAFTTVAFQNAYILNDGQYFAVTKPLQYEGKSLQRCVLKNDVYHYNSDEQLIYVGKFKDGKVKWKNISL